MQRSVRRASHSLEASAHASHWLERCIHPHLYVLLLPVDCPLPDVAYRSFSWMIRKWAVHGQNLAAMAYFVVSLAAVDMHTAQHLVRNAFSGELAKDRTIILVTHHISLCLPITSYLLELSGGRVTLQGSVEDLRSEGELHTPPEVEDSIIEEKPLDLSEKLTENEADNVATSARPTVERTRSSGKLVEAEARAEGRVSMRSYMTYIRAAGVIAWILTVLLLLLIRLINIGSQVCAVLRHSLNVLTGAPVFHGALG